MRAPTRVFRAAALIALVGVASGGCASFPAHLGVRPNEPAVPLLDSKGEGFCHEYREYAKYAQGLQEAYHSRSTQNRWWIYVAGITGLGVAAASGGLAVAAAAGTTTLALLSISGGATAGAFVALDNEGLAQNYTTAANQVDKALADAENLRLGTADAKVGDFRLSDIKVGDVKIVDLLVDGRKVGDVKVGNTTLAEVKAGDIKLVRPVSATPGDENACRFALVSLKAQVSEARQALESARTKTAAGALHRALGEREALDKLIEKYQKTK